MTGSGSGNRDWDIQILIGKVNRLEEEFERKREILHGNGVREGLLTRLSNLERDTKRLLNWQGGWSETTNVAHFQRQMQRLSDLRHEVEELDKKINKYSVYAVIGIWIITILLQIFGPKIAGLF